MKAVIFANGSMTDAAAAMEHLRKAALIIAVDGGARHLSKFNVLPHVLLGDLDSVQKDILREYEKAGVAIEAHPVDKDKTDLELALDLAVAKQVSSASVFGALGRRWDMSMANLMLPTAPAYSSMQITLHDESTIIHIIHGGDELRITSTPDRRVSLIPAGGTATGITLHGFKYPLTKHTISHASTRGISNSLLDREGKIFLESGTLLCIIS